MEDIKNIKAIIDLKGKCQSVIKWRLTDVCNYRCSYCIRHSWSKKPQDLKYLQEDIKLINETAPEVARIINEMPGKVKLDLIGGEVSLLDLTSILTTLFKICGNKLFRINITTNMSNSAEYYTNLCNLVASYGAELGVTCSFHSEFTTLDKFISKIKQIKHPTAQKEIRAELVSHLYNQELVRQFIDICEKEGITYFVERDLSADPEIKSQLLIGSSKKKLDRYKVISDTNEEKLYKTRNEVISGNLSDYGHYLELNGLYCTRDYDYVYIEKDEHIGRIGDSDCKQRENIFYFHPLTEPKLCIKPGCTLCGHMSVSKVKELLMLDKEGQEK